LKILHINDQAGVACILAKYQNMNEIESKVLVSNSILTTFNFDKFGILKYYNDQVKVIEGLNFIKYVISEADKADVIHIHSKEEIVVKLRQIFGNSKKIILHYHGTDIRGFRPKYSILKNVKTKTKIFAVNVRTRLRLMNLGYYKSLEKLHSESQRLADQVIVSTPDLLTLITNSRYLPNPVDLEHFSDSKNKRNDMQYNNNALTIQTETGNSQKTLQYCKTNNINFKIDIFDRTKKPLSYQDIPNLLKKYSVYVDIRIVNGKILENLSKTALESLSCGLKVLNYKLEYIDKFPEVHNPIKVINQLHNIYKTI